MTKNIPVGDYPSFTNAFPSTDSTDAVYVANSGSGTVSVIDPSTNEVVAGVTFDIIPFRAGRIICDGSDTPLT